MVKTRTIILVVALSFIAIFLIFMISVFSLLMSDETSGSGNIAIIPVKGVILSDDTESFLSSGIASSTDIIKAIERADKNPQIKAIILEINSPGGSAVASDEIGQALKSTNKTKIAWIREIGTSGAYWVASACDVVIANRMSITGSIGVISSYLEFSGVMDDYNVTYQRLVSGEYKDIGSPFRKLTIDEEDILQAQLDEVHDFFIEEVAENRGLSVDETRQFSNGLFFIGADAKEMGLIDVLGGKKEAIEYIENELGIKSKIVEYKKKHSLLDILASVIYKGAFNTGRGFAFEMFKQDIDQYSLKLVSN